MNKLVEVLLGVILPPLIDVINSKVKDSKVRYGVSLLVCVLVGVVLNRQSVSMVNVLGSASLIFASAQTVYNAYWQESGLRKQFKKAVK